jgi:hypothetical protein
MALGANGSLVVAILAFVPERFLSVSVHSLRGIRGSEWRAGRTRIGSAHNSA